MGESKIKQGYKKTPVGMIPEDWEVKKLAKIGSFYKGKGISKSQLSETGLKAIRYGEIYTVHHYFIKQFYSFIDRNVAKASFPLISGDLLFTGSGETLEEIGKSVAFIGEEEVYAGGDIIILRPDKNSYNSKFLGFITNNDIFRKQTFRVGQGNAVVHIYPSNLKNLKLPIPPLPEQKAIADCLSTWDKAIEKLSALIASKKEQKKGLMQGLFSGKLKVENGELVKVEDKENWLKGWKEVLLKTISTITKGKQLNRSELNEADKYPSYSGGITPSGYTDKYNCDANTIIISEGGNSCGYVNFIDVDFWLGGHCYSIENNAKKMNKNFLYNILKYNEPKIMRLRVGSGLPNVQKGDLEKFKLKVPSLKEQTEIAEVFNAANKEIELLEQKLESFKTQKKGLMQVLLTGEKRLVES